MRIHSAILTILACSALAGCGGSEAAAERERPKDFRTAADEVCREHNARVSEGRDEVRGKQVTLDEFVGAVNDEALIKEDELRDLRALKPPAEAKPWLARLQRNVEGMRKAAREVRDDDGGASYEAFYSQLTNSDIRARDLADELGLQECSPPSTGL